MNKLHSKSVRIIHFLHNKETISFSCWWAYFINFFFHSGACFQTPTCYDQSDNNIIDTYGTRTGHSGSSDTIFNMNYPQPTEHFPAFSSVWHDLTWTFDLNEFPEAAINSDTGI
jgi:hypothetical protein